MGELRASQASPPPVADHPATWFVNSLHDGNRCSICALPLHPCEAVTVLDAEKVFSATEKDFYGPIKVIYHSDCIGEWVIVQ